jgi:3-isopropylmalate dehydrogenase
MASYRIGVMMGDGIGPEVVGAAVDVLQAAARPEEGLVLALEPLPMGLAAIETHGGPLPVSTIEALSGCHGWILGPHDSVAYPEAFRETLNPSGLLRRRFDLYMNIRPARTYASVPSVAGKQVDLIVLRENTEGFYADRNMYAGAGEFMPTPDVALAVGVFTRRALERIASSAFRFARTRRSKVTAVHKANVLRMSYGLFLECCNGVAAQFPDVEFDHYHIDAMAAHLVRRPGDFDVVVTTNMFGDILSDLAAELTGSLGLAGALNAGDEHAMAQATHGSAPDIAGKGIANPTGEILSTALLMRWLGERHEDAAVTAVAGRMERAVEMALESVRTPDLGGTATTRAFTSAVIDCLR